MSPRGPLTYIFRSGRPVLRVQLTLLYSGLFLGVLAAALFAAGVLYQHSAARAPNGASAASVGGSHAFDTGPAIIGLIAAVVAIAGAWWLAGRFLRPLRAIAATAQDISAANLNRRLHLSGPNDELTDLGRTLDDLFGRLEASFDAQRHFVANASHELRTPLAGQRTLLQVALADPDADAQSLRAVCEEALQLGGQQERLIEALLTLATSERGVERWEPVDLAEITGSVLAARQDAARHERLHIATTLNAAPTTGDPRLVASLVANLIDNALRHNVDDGHVSITTDSTPEQAVIKVSNTGPAIAGQEIERLFQPFQRTGANRVQHDGHGLGLAIVSAIAEAHAAALNAEPRPHGGLDVEVRFRKPGIASA
ncbi:sensor histidine kinase [Leekyejoonella antrihumi]|uniref:histidine kinase n=1 Tax=Leekyejoonella antrihumi TaxID=1660198 RepID=A0A563E3W7_9MICO|nr:HAMP domain-containing sensor histidine kinase [Leekyejoonella antrihumi]TWP37220.1 HAMP domain-containing histidine kinase [Leekyejoonella antrihumi]